MAIHDVYRDSSSLVLVNIFWTLTMLLRQAESEEIRVNFIVYIATVVENKFILSCGGTIISSSRVLTSANCVNPHLEAYIVAGSQVFDLRLPINPSSFSLDQQTRKAAMIQVHELFKPGFYEYDVALVALNDELILNDNVSLLNVRLGWLEPHDPVYIFGWRHSTPSPLNNAVTLWWAKTNVICRSKVKNWAEPEAFDKLNFSTDGELFFKDKLGKESFCYGDSGSPVIQDGDIFGIASFGIEYNCKGLNAASNIWRHFNWIKRNNSTLEAKSEEYVKKNESNQWRKKQEIIHEKVIKNKIPWQGRQPRVPDGHQVLSAEAIPFLVGIAYFAYDDPAYYEKPRCSGSIITQWIILTAAHCIEPREMIVYAGVIDYRDFTQSKDYQQAIKVAETRVHSEYTPDKPKDNDIGLMRLQSALKLSSRVATICHLPTSDPAVGTSLYLAGWGYLKDNSQPTYSTWANVTVEAIQRSRKLVYLASMTGYVTCRGDSGGPIFNDEHELFGTNAFAVNDPPNYPPGQMCGNDGAGASSSAGHRLTLFSEIVDLEKDLP